MVGAGGGVLSCPRCVGRASSISMVYDQSGRPGSAPYNPHVLHQGAHSSTYSSHCYCVFIVLVYAVKSPLIHSPGADQAEVNI